jgi:hypothetical protein
MGWAALGKVAMGAVKSKAKEIATDKLLNRKKNVKKRRGKAQEAMGGGEEQQDKRGALAIRPTTSLVPTGPGAIVSSPGGDLPTTGDRGGGGSAYELATSISTKIIRVEKLLKGSALIKKDLRDDLRKQAKIDEDKLQEKALEKQKVKSKTKFKIPGTEAAKGILSKVFNFFSTVLLGWIAVRLVDWLPKLMPVLKAVGNIADMILKGAEVIISALASVIDFGYKLVDKMEGWVKTTYGEEGAEKFRTFMGNLKDLVSAFLVWKIIGEKIFKAVVGFAKNIWNTVTKAIRTIWVKLRRLVGRHVRKFFGKLVERAGGVLKNVGQGIFNVGKNVVGRVGGLFSQGAGKLASTGAGKVVAKVGGWAGKLFGKAASIIAPALKAAKPVASKFLKRIPIFGSLIVGIISLMSGEPLGQALFKTIGAAVGGALGTFIPIPIIGTLLGEAIGSFIGDLLYYTVIKRDPKKAMEVLKQTLMGIFTAGKAVFDWVKNGFGNFITNFKEEHMVKLPKVLGVQVTLPGIGDKIPNLLQLYNPFAMAPLLVKSFFKGGGKGKSSESSGGSTVSSTSSKGKEESTFEKKLKPLSKDLIDVNKESGAQGVIDSISNRASYEELPASTTIVKIPPPVVPSSVVGGKGAGETQIVPMVVGSGEDPYESLDYFG